MVTKLAKDIRDYVPAAEPEAKRSRRYSSRPVDSVVDLVVGYHTLLRRLMPHSLMLSVCIYVECMCHGWLSRGRACLK